MSNVSPELRAKWNDEILRWNNASRRLAAFIIIQEFQLETGKEVLNPEFNKALSALIESEPSLVDSIRHDIEHNKRAYPMHESWPQAAETMLAQVIELLPAHEPVSTQ